MNNKKICFITCVNNDRQYEECLLYINNIQIPEGYEIDCISIKEAESITSAYNAAMNGTDAKYKVYLHQDTYIINKNFIYDILNTFNSDDKIGMIGVIGAKTIETDGVWWNSNKTCGKVYDNHNGIMQELKLAEIESNYEEVKIVDGLVMITQYDLNWREDIINEWHFYNVSQCLEFIKSEYRVVVHKQIEPWCVHDCGISNLDANYDKWRDIFIKEYSKDVIEILKDEVKKNKYPDEDEIIKWRNYYIDALKDNDDVHLLEEYLINKYDLANKDDDELFSFDKIKGLEIINSNKEEFHRYLYEAKFNLNNRDYEQASRWCFKAASFAAENHPGFYKSNELEDILIECANNLPEAQKNEVIKISNTGKRRVLHVLSEGYSVGGHTRLVKNWIEKDKESEHSLITTWQMETMPSWLLDEVKLSGGWSHSLQGITNFTERAAILRKIAYEHADIVVLHIHMYDPIPVMAFGVEGGTPILFMNHGDHVFWIGTSIIDMLINYREAGRDLSVKRRNVDRNCMLPLPLNPPKNSIKYRDDLRAELGIKEDTILLLTIASEYKFKTFGKMHYLDIIKEVIKLNPNVMLIVIGPNKSGIWEESYNETKGRILPLGLREDIEPYYAIADIYVDSYMIGSNTSALDAGVRRLPIASLGNNANPTLSFNDVSYDEGFDNIKDFLSFINKLIEDKYFRKDRGINLSNILKNDHVSNWMSYLDSIYDETKNINHKIYNSEKDLKNIMQENDLFLALFQKKQINKSHNYDNLKNYFKKYKRENNVRLLRLIGEKVLEANSNDYKVLYELAKSYQKDNFILANRYYNKAIECSPKNSQSGEIILDYVKLNFNDNTYKIMQENLKYNKDNEEYLYRHLIKTARKNVDNYFNNQLYEKALEYLNSVDSVKAKLYKVKSIKEYCKEKNLLYKVVEKEKKREVFEPYYFGIDEEPKTEKFTSPEIYISELNNVEVVGENSFIISEDICLYDMAKKNLDGRYDLRAVSILEIDTKYALIQCIDSKKEIEFAISLLGVAASNYYHFTVELLSRIQYIDNFEEYRSVPILVDKAVKNIPQYYDLLNTINKYNHPVIFIDKNMNYKIKKLVYVSYNTWMPLNIKEGLKLCRRDSLISESAIKYIRNSIIEDTNRKGFRKIFISRKNSFNSRLINEKDIVELFKIYGFEIIFPEEMNFKQQVKIFSEAEYVAGTTGAAFTNIIYCPKNAKILCIIPKEYNFNIYSTIANLLDLQALFIDAEEVLVEKQKAASRYVLNTNFCNDILKVMFYEKNNIYEIPVLLEDIKHTLYKKHSASNKEIIDKIFCDLDRLKSINFHNNADNYFSAINLIKNTADSINDIAKIKNTTEKITLIKILHEYINANLMINI